MMTRISYLTGMTASQLALTLLALAMGIAGVACFCVG